MVARTKLVRQPTFLRSLTNFFKVTRALPLQPEPTSAELLLAGGFPEVTEATTPEKEVVTLLQAGAEIEHALLVEYLYAAFSVNPLLGSLRDAIVTIAIQEMSHLITVQNLLLFLGAKPYLEREDVSPNPELDPFPFTLSGVCNRTTLERFLLAEMPERSKVPPEWGDTVDEIKSRVDPKSKFHRVGLIYARVFWLLQPSDAPQQPWPGLKDIADLGALPVGKNWHVRNFPGSNTSTTTQASRDERGKRPDGEGEIWLQDYGAQGVFRTIHNIDDALQAVFDIAAQGEGVVDSGAMSHFAQFFSLVSDYPSFPREFLLPVPDNPQLGPAAAVNATVTDPSASGLCELLNIRYQIAITSITCALWYSRALPQENQRRQQLVGWAFFEMREALKSLARFIVRLPCQSGGDATVLAAAPTFQLDGLSLPENVKGLEVVLAGLHVRAQAVCTELGRLPLDTGAAKVVATIMQADLDRYPTS
ncbi:ferritin-like domain-containing protein [Bradyrhizobium betae]